MKKHHKIPKPNKATRPEINTFIVSMKLSGFGWKILTTGRRQEVCEQIISATKKNLGPKAEEFRWYMLNNETGDIS